MKKQATDLFGEEHRLLSQIRGILAQDALSSPEAHLQLGRLADGYQSLLSQVQRMIKISDTTENRLFRTNYQLMEAQVAIEEEKGKYETLLLSVFPETIGQELLQNRQVAPRRFESATVMFTDFVNFTQLTALIDPVLLIRELNDVFCAFDHIMLRNGCGRIKTIGDGYMAVCGVPHPDNDHALKMVRAALECIQYLLIRNDQLSEQSLGIVWEIRIGINSGPVVGGIVGTQHFTYDIFGDTVNTASRLEHQAAVNGIVFSESTKALIEGRMPFRPLGSKTIKGKGLVALYTVSNEGMDEWDGVLDEVLESD